MPREIITIECTEARKEGKSPLEIAAFYTQAFMDDEAQVNILPAHVFPRATDHVPEMIDITRRLLAKGIKPVFLRFRDDKPVGDCVRRSEEQSGTAAGPPASTGRVGSVAPRAPLRTSAMPTPVRLSRSGSALAGRKV